MRGKFHIHNFLRVCEYSSMLMEEHKWKRKGEQHADEEHLSKLFLPIMITIRCTFMLAQHIQGRWHGIKTRETNLKIRKRPRNTNLSLKGASSITLKHNRRTIKG